MNAFRFPAFQRVVALLLFAGAGVACLPVASAAETVEAAFESELKAALGNAEAVDLALEAARQTLTPNAAVDAFVEAYVEAVGDPSIAQDVARLFLDDLNRFGAPALPLNQAVWTAATSASPLIHRTANAVLVQAQPSIGALTGDVVETYAGPSAHDLRTLRTQQARAP